jgi:hypothetical protein
MGNADFCMGNGHQRWVLNYNGICPEDFWLIGFWWDKLFSDIDFTNQLINRWQSLRQTTFTLDNIYNIIDSSAALLQEAQARNYTKFDVLNEYIWPNGYIGGTYQNEVQWLKDWFAKRINWIDSNIKDISGQVKGSSSNSVQKVYPNPVRDEMIIELQIETEGEAEFIIYNVMGQVIARLDLEPIFGINTRYRVPTILVQQLTGGMYFYQLNISNLLSITGKFVKE